MNFFFQYMNDLHFMTPMLYFVVSVCFLLVYGSLIISNKQLNYPILSTTMNKTSIGLYLILCLLLSTSLMSTPPFGFNSITGSGFANNWNNSTILVLLSFASLTVLIGNQAHMKQTKLVNYETTLIMLFSFIAMYTIVCSTSFLSLYLGLELQALTFYILAGLQRNSSFSTEASLKYFILGSFISGIMLFGIGLIYMETGTLLFENLTRLVWSVEMSLTFTQGMLLVLISMLFKVGAAPFHQWLPDVYEGSPSLTSAYFAIIPKLVIFYILLVLTQGPFSPFIEIWSPLLMASAVLSICVGIFSSLTQQKFKRFLAYSSIAHTGYMLLGISTGTFEGMTGSLVYSVLYLLMSISLWMSLLAFRRYKEQSTSTGLITYQTFYLSNLTELYTTNKALAFTIGLSIFSMAGIPPLGGFLAKFLVLFAATKAQFYLINALLMGLAVIGAFYYLRWLKLMFFEIKTQNSVLTLYKPISASLAWVLIMSTNGLVLLLINPEPIMNWAKCFILI